MLNARSSGIVASASAAKACRSLKSSLQSHKPMFTQSTFCHGKRSLMRVLSHTVGVCSSAIPPGKCKLITVTCMRQPAPVHCCQMPPGSPLLAEVPDAGLTCLRAPAQGQPSAAARGL